MPNPQWPPSPAAILFLLLIFAFNHAAVNGLPDRISINCGSASPSSSSHRTEWMPDVYPKFSYSPVSIKGVSTRASVTRDHSMVDSVPYGTARVSTSQFSYNFNLIPGHKYVRLHFNPTSYKFNSGIFRKKWYDSFSVKAGPFTLLSNFSASTASRVRGLNVIIKEFCLYVPDYQPFSIGFTPAVSFSSSEGFYAFINGIEIISVPSGSSYCHDGDVGVQILGRKSVVYIDSSTALEMAHRFIVIRDSGTADLGDDNIAMFRMGAMVAGVMKKKGKFDTWKVAVDVGFRYLIKLHFCEIYLKMAEDGSKDFMVLIDGMIAATDADGVQEREEGKGVLWYKNYMVMVNGNKHEGLRDISISLHSKDEFVNGYGPLKGFEIFKLSNSDHSLASLNPLPPTGYSHSSRTRKFLTALGPTNVITAVAVIVCCLVSLFKVQQSGDCNLPEEGENMPSTPSICRRFSLAELQSATDDFFDANVIGKGGFGKVYRGLIDNGNKTVAIKRLKQSSNQGKREFQTEIKLLSELRHVNVISLVGWCSEKQEMLLVYEHVTGGSLADHLYKLAREDRTFHSLSWKKRLEICIGAGRGLDYLHTGHGIIHRDIKASNILLDDKFEAKISDFGLAKIHTGQSQANSNFKGTFGYMDPAYLRTHNLTMKSDTYAFGVMLLEVLCGRPAVEQWAEDENRSLTMWALDKISKGEVDQIVASNIRDEILPASLNTFVRIVERCLDDEPKNRPAIAHVVVHLEFALEQQEKANSSVPNETVGMVDALPITDDAVQMTNALSQYEIEDVPVLPPQVNEIKLEPVVRVREQEHVRGFPKFGDWSAVDLQYSFSEPLVRGRKQEVMRSSNGKNVASSSKNVTKTDFREQEHVPVLPTFGDWSTVDQQSSITLSLGREKEVLSSSKDRSVTSSLKNVAKTTMRELSRLWPLDARKNGKSSKRKESIISAPAGYRTANRKQNDGTLSRDKIDGEFVLTPHLRVFSYPELRTITRSFHADSFIGAGRFGRGFKGFLKENGIETAVAVKQRISESAQGIQEWLSEIKFLGKLSHPNLVKLLGYCCEDKQLFLVYEYMGKGSLEDHLFRRGSLALPWDIRLKIFIGAAHGLAYLHSVKKKVIYRDFKSCNILLDESYNSKLSDFGLAKEGPGDEYTHVTTQPMGTYGYAAPEYILTGHLYAKSAVYGFGVVLLEMLTGLQAIDGSRPPAEKNLVEWIKPHLSKREKLRRVMDPRLQGKFSINSAFQIAQLARNCLEHDPRKRPSSQEIVNKLEKLQSI